MEGGTYVMSYNIKNYLSIKSWRWVFGFKYLVIVRRERGARVREGNTLEMLSQQNFDC